MQHTGTTLNVIYYQMSTNRQTDKTLQGYNDKSTIETQHSAAQQQSIIFLDLLTTSFNVVSHTFKCRSTEITYSIHNYT